MDARTRDTHMIFPVWGTSPLLYAVALLILLAVFWRWLPGGVRWPGVALEVVLLFLTTPVGAWALTRLLIVQLPPANACAAPQPTTVVVISAGIEHFPDGPHDYAALNLLSLERLFTGVALWHRIPDGKLVISGGGYRRIPDAVLMASLAAHLGVPSRDIQLEDRSRTTWENARFVAALSPPVPKRIWLVTSARHMPRALGAFRAWDFEPCAWPSGLADTRLHFGAYSFVPQGRALTASTVALHELAGQAEYAWLEWRLRRSGTNRKSPKSQGDQPP